PSSRLHLSLPSFPTRRSSDLFDESAALFHSPKVVTSGNPVRFNVDASPLELHHPLQILVLGGSTGAHRLNEGVINALRNLREAVDRKSTRLNSSHGSISYAVF